MAGGGASPLIIAIIIPMILLLCGSKIVLLMSKYETKFEPQEFAWSPPLTPQSPSNSVCLFTGTCVVEFSRQIYCYVLLASSSLAVVVTTYDRVK